MTPVPPETCARIGILTSHPIQYQAPWFRELAKEVKLEVFFAYHPSAEEQGEGFGKAFAWDVDLLSGYSHRTLVNVAKSPGAAHYGGCDTPEIARLIREGGFQAFIVNGWYLKCYWQAVNACRKAGIPVLVRGDSQLMTPRSKLKEWAKTVAYRQMLKRFDGFLTVGQRNQEYLRHYGVPEGKLHRAPHFIDNSWFAIRTAEESDIVRSLRTEWQASDQDFVVGFAGKLIAKKRPFDLLAACALLPPSIGCRLVFIGAGALEESLRDQASKLGLVPVFSGFKNQSELPAAYGALDALVLPSDGGETWGLVVNEAMACGTPVIVSESCGCAPDLVEPGVTGFTYPTGDVTALAEQLTRMATLKRSGHDWRPALKKKLESYSVEACTAGTLAAVESVIATRR